MRSCTKHSLNVGGVKVMLLGYDMYDDDAGGAGGAGGAPAR